MPEVSVAKANGQHVIPPAPPDPRQADYMKYLALLDESFVPSNLHMGIASYLAAGIRPGSFLRAVLSGDHAVAVRRADPATLAGYGFLILWLAQHAPADAWGSDENVDQWLAQFPRGRQA